MQLAKLSDKELIASIAGICLEGYARTARLLVLLIEVEERRLHLRSARSSMFNFCVHQLGMSEGTAARRISAARLVKEFPALLPSIERGDLHLSTLELLRPHLTK